jgi:dienelactone hydrolase
VRTTIIAFGGYLYSIAKWLPSHVIHYSAGAWGFTQRWCRDFSATIREPVTLIGFSEGANAALQVASHSPMVTRAIVHSCEDKPVAFNAACDYRFFATLGDTTPTFDGTIETATRAMKDRVRFQLQFLPRLPFESPTWFERKVLAPRNHIFHNVLPHLPALGV